MSAQIVDSTSLRSSMGALLFYSTVAPDLCSHARSTAVATELGCPPLAAVSYLIERGHSRIGLITGPDSTWDGRLRKRGYLNSLREHGLPVSNDLIFEVDFFSENDSHEAMAKLMALPDPPTAVFSASDLHAIEAMLYAVDSGYSVPDDVAIVGFDNTREATMVRRNVNTT